MYAIRLLPVFTTPQLPVLIVLCFFVYDELRAAAVFGNVIFTKQSGQPDPA
jgi:hypothetical protein